MSESFRDNYRVTYVVDLVFCIDTTGSMEHIIDIVKQNAINLYTDIQKSMAEKNKKIDTMRVRLISFKDYLADGMDAIATSEFFTLPSEANDLKNCVSVFDASGGGDDPEDGLEALAFAMRSSWNNDGIKKRHVIVVWSDAPTHQIGYGRTATNYPENMPESFQALSLWWGDPQNPGLMDQRAKRLLMFVPNAPEWSRITKEWDNVIHVPQVSKGLNDLDYQEVISAISNSI